jgi:hypothetical protein
MNCFFNFQENYYSIYSSYEQGFNSWCGTGCQAYGRISPDEQLQADDCITNEGESGYDD